VSKLYRLPYGSTCRSKKEYLETWTSVGEEYVREILGNDWRLGGFDPGFLFHHKDSRADSVSIPSFVVLGTLVALENARSNGYC